MSEKTARRSWRTELQRFFRASTSLEAQLYPALKLDVRFRPYNSGDFESCMTIYDRNQPGRFPPNDRSKFEEYLKRDQKTLIVADCGSRVIACGGILLVAANVGVLCYGLVDPEFQRKRIGATLALLRIAQLPDLHEGVIVLIFAVKASMPVYRRFGFVDQGKWKNGETESHPVGVQHVSWITLRRIKRVLQEREVCVEGGQMPLHKSEEHECHVESTGNGYVRVRFERRAETASK